MAASFLSTHVLPHFDALPLRKKLLLVIVGVCTTALLLAAGLGIAFSWFNQRQELINKLSVTANILSLESQATLEFMDRDAAAQNLQSLMLEPSIEMACLYDADGQVFASYLRPSTDKADQEMRSCPTHHVYRLNRFTRTNLELYRPILAQQHQVGALYLAYDLSEAYSRLAQELFYTLIIVAMAVLLVIPISHYVQRRISGPVMQLAELSRRFSQDRSVTAAPIAVGPDEIGELVTAFSGMMEEIRRNESRLERVISELSRSNTELERFAYICSHDLQEPLRMVSNYTHMLERKYKDRLDGDALTYMHFITDGALRMRELVSDILAYSRIGHQSEPMQPVDLNSVLTHVQRNLQTSIRERQAVLRVEELPVVTANRTLLAQIFQNLVANAIKFCREKKPEIGIKAMAHEREWEFTVADNGIGIDPRYYDKIFEIFKRLNRREEFQGTGIGLAICKKAVEYHGGRIWVESVLGQGTTFHFTLPKPAAGQHRTDRESS